MLPSHRNFSNSILHTVRRTLTYYHMLEYGDSVLTGVSGGADSVALLHILRKLSPDFSLRLGIAHLNHCLRGDESERDARFVARLAETMNIPCFTDSKDVKSHAREKKGSVEETARQLRYDFFDTVAKEKGFQRIALGHHADDNAELFLMFLLRGSGRTGLSGIPPAREGKYIRPLFDLTGSDIRAYINVINADYVSDSSNRDPRYLRNRLRHRLIPHLEKEYNPKTVRILHQTSRVFREEEEWLEKLTGDLFEKVRKKKQEDALLLSVPDMLAAPPAARKRLIRMALKEIKGDLRQIRFAHTEDLLRMLAENPSDFLMDLPDRIRARREGDFLHLRKEKCSLRTMGRQSPPGLSFHYLVTGPGDVFLREIGKCLRFSLPETLPDYRFQGSHTAFFDLAETAFPITVRNFQPGDSFRPLGMQGTQKVKKFFADRKIPRSEREKCPILLSRNRIIWLAGYRMDHSVRIRTGTEKVLKAELLLA